MNSAQTAFILDIVKNGFNYYQMVWIHGIRNVTGIGGNKRMADTIQALDRALEPLIYLNKQAGPDGV